VIPWTCKVLPSAFTAHGAIQAANLLASPHAVAMGIFAACAFLRMRERASVPADLSKRLDGPEQKSEGPPLSRDAFGRNARLQLRLLFEAILEPMSQPNLPKWPMRFVTIGVKAKKGSRFTNRKT
jgi:hypothetical protein